jgi:hypothetical protein
MGLIGWLIGGVIGGIAGAGAWAGVAYGTGYESGWIAWGVGLLVGLGVRIGGGSEPGGQPAGALAAVIAILSILGGKYYAMQLFLEDELGPESEMLESAISQLGDYDYLLSLVAHDIVHEYEDEDDGRALDWPPGKSHQEAGMARGDFPADVWTDAEQRYAAMSADERMAYIKDVEAGMRADFAAWAEENRDLLAEEGFLQSFGLFDLVFGVLAIATAFSIGSGMKSEE